MREKEKATPQPTDNQIKIAKPFISITEASEYLSLSKPTLYQYTSKHLIPFYKINRKILFKVSELNEYIENHRVSSVAEIESAAISSLVSGKWGYYAKTNNQEIQPLSV